MRQLFQGDLVNLIVKLDLLVRKQDEIDNKKNTSLPNIFDRVIGEQTKV